ncbi:MAG: ATP-binding protein [Clostridiales bacterium]
MKKFAEMKEDLNRLALPLGLLIVSSYPEYNIIFANAKFNEMVGFDSQKETQENSEKSAWEFVYAEDIPWLKEEAATRNGKAETYEIAYRIVNTNGGIIWVNQYSQHMIGENGEELILAYYTDITSQKQMEETIRNGIKKYETLINSIPGGVGMYQINEEFTPLFISDRVYELCNMTKEEYDEATRHSTLDVFHPDDRQGLIDTVKAAYKNKEKFYYTHRVLQKDKTYRWMRVSGEIMETNYGNPILYTVFSDVDEQIKAEEALRKSEFRYAVAIKASNINIWEYDYKEDTMTIFSTSPKVNPQNNIITDYSHSVVEEGHIRDDSAVELFDMLKKLKNGEKEVTADLWIREQRNSDFWCERVIYTNIFDDRGKPTKAYCVGRDVTKEKEAQKRYRDELTYREAMQKATMASVNVNLTKNIIVDYKSNFPQIAANMSKAKTAQDYFDQVSTELTTDEMKEKCATVFNRDALLRCFANGETTLTLELTRKIEGRRYWTVVTAHMMKRPEDREIMAFIYSTNITNERTMQDVMNAIVKTDYDFLVVVDALRNSAVRYSEKNLANTYAYESENFEEETKQYIEEYVCKEDVTRVLHEISLKNILSHLNNQGVYNVFYAVPNNKGGKLQKQLRFSYINRELQSFLMTRTDITAAVEEQEKKNQELLIAAKIAENANAAKSEFLSRISHEIRTPMNAIIGMSQIALKSLDDKAFAKESIEKSLYASQYLLLLLNDILDMSKIESGKVSLTYGNIVCEDFVDAISTIIGVQAETKGVKYIISKCVDCQKSYIGDGVRLQQILINILSNAVKFTPKGGTVELNISQLGADKKNATICFEIKDTGIGISEEFLPKLFEPFAQEHQGFTSDYVGSGLGLAISKNLVRLMKGEILVKSVPKEGTTFRVIIPMGISSDATANSTIKPIRKEHINYDFSGKRFLLVEDHQLNIMVAKKLLEFKNAQVDVAENGKLGLDMFAAAQDLPYDAVLMDIRMPIMDGLESAKCIRNLDSFWAKSVPIIAMSANAFDEDITKSKNVGMNAHLAKPIDSELLYYTLYQLLPKEGEKTNG